VTEVLKDVPVSTLVGIGQSRSGNESTKAYVVELLPMGFQTGFNVTLAFAARHLSISKTQKLIEREKLSHSVVATVATNTQIKVVPWQKLQQLPENRLA
jgi:S-ribosylhomocysteine lyase LuxS involved in autoinducer biosynthesis